MAAIPISGMNVTLIASNTWRSILRTASGAAPDFDGDGRVFELLGLLISNTSALSVARLQMWDNDNVTSTPSTVRRVGPELRIAPGDTQKLEWPRGSGPRFTIGIVMTKADNGGTVGVRNVNANGLLH